MEIQTGLAVAETLLPRETEATRVYGDFALTNSTLRDAGGRRYRRLEMAVKQQGGTQPTAHETMWRCG
jgi:hypothetical protein